jgi:hypothetical protein
MDFDYRVDISEVQRGIDSSEVIALYFPLLRKTLLMDTRHNAVDGPLIKVVPMASSAEERFRELRRLRPRFPRPESLTLIPWPKYVSSLVQLEVWDHIVRRFVDVGSPDIVRQCEACLRELRDAEREELRRAITGEHYQSLWDVSGAHEEGAEVEEDDDEA